MQISILSLLTPLDLFQTPKMVIVKGQNYDMRLICFTTVTPFDPLPMYSGDWRRGVPMSVLERHDKYVKEHLDIK